MTDEESCGLCYCNFNKTLEERHFYHEECGVYFCEECSGIWRRATAATNWQSIDCPSCGATIPSDKLFDHLTEEEKEDFHLKQFYCMETSEDEKWLNCAHCGYKEIGDLDDTFLLCKNESCKQLSCLICHKTINYSADRLIPFKSLTSNQTALRSVIEDIEKEIKIHAKCCEHADLIRRIERAMEDSTSRKCPCCNHRGRKDENCTHITCEKCGSYWCYICLKELDGNHNDLNDVSDFESNCPMYMYRVSEFRSSWPSDSEDALAKFHHHLGLYRLHCLFNSLDELEKDSFEEIYNLFPHLLNGFELCAIKQFGGYIFQE